MFKLIFVIALFSAFIGEAAVINEAVRIEARGRLIRQRNQQLLRAGDTVYQLEFPNNSLRNFAAQMTGETVVVRGEFRARRQNGTTRLIITPEYIESETGTQEVSTGEETFTLDLPPPPAETPQPAPAAEVAVETEPEPPAALPLPYNRWDARRRAVLEKKRYPTWGTRVIITPGGGTIIMNNQ